ncbi:MAG: relaxase/mobilization nuclease domain-containing protein [Flavobacterium sp.]
MIGLAKACNGGGALANYVLDENKGYELDRNSLCGFTPKEIVEEMKMIQDLNQRAINKTFSMVLSPDVKDGKNLSDIELKEMTRQYLKELGVNPEKQQYIAFVHTEKEHKHIHIIANRVQADGKLISDHHIGKKGQWVAHGIAKERGLVSAKEKMFENLKNRDENKSDPKGIKANIYKKHQSVMKTQPKTFSDYTDAMSKLDLEIKPTINKQGQIQGFRVIEKESNSNFKMSELHRSMSANNLIKSGLKNDLKHDLDQTLKKAVPKEFVKTLIHKNSSSIENNTPKEKNDFKSKFSFNGLGKEKMTKEQYKEALEYGKHIDEVIQPNIIIKHHHSFEDIKKNDDKLIHKQEIKNTEKSEKDTLKNKDLER